MYRNKHDILSSHLSLNREQSKVVAKMTVTADRRRLQQLTSLAPVLGNRDANQLTEQTKSLGEMNIIGSNTTTLAPHDKYESTIEAHRKQP